jgi:hypothetical protein
LCVFLILVWHRRLVDRCHRHHGLPLPLLFSHAPCSCARVTLGSHNLTLLLLTLTLTLGVPCSPTHHFTTPYHWKRSITPCLCCPPWRQSKSPPCCLPPLESPSRHRYPFSCVGKHNASFRTASGALDSPLLDGLPHSSLCSLSSARSSPNPPRPLRRSLSMLPPLRTAGPPFVVPSSCDGESSLRRFLLPSPTHPRTKPPPFTRRSLETPTRMFIQTG